MGKRSLRNVKRKGGRTRKQKMYNMKGCSKLRRCSKSKRCMSGGQGCGSYGCPIAPFSWKQMQQQQGGNGISCGTCNQSGGNHFYKPPAPIPGPFVGQSWTPEISRWPGVNGISGDSNYLAQNLYNHGDPQTMMKLGGSKRNKSKRINRSKLLRGGGLIPQDLVNLGSNLSFNFKSAYNALNGYSAPTNPLPYRDQLSGSKTISVYKALV
jgi:hypothetical protein